jgi:CHASE2 domain-containing sensor protein
MPATKKYSDGDLSSEQQPLWAVYATRILFVLGVVFMIAYLVFGDRMLFGHVATFELDAALRGTLVGRYDPRSIMPITIVEIDDATAAQPAPGADSWGFSDVTPRDKLAKMLKVIAASLPAVMVVDVDLADDRNGLPQSESPMDHELQNFLKGYVGPSLIFVKRTEESPSGQIQLARSTLFDAVIAENANLSWAEATYTTDPDGTVRRWSEWLTACAASDTIAVPAVPLRILATWPRQSSQQFMRPSALSSAGPCTSGDNRSPSHIVIYDEALSRIHGVDLSRSLSRISAWQVLDPRVKRDDRSLFAQRAVLIGGTRSGTADLWRTPVGLLSGVELMANTIRFAPGQLRESRYAVMDTLAFFVIFCVLKFFFRPIVAIVLGIVLCAGAVAFGGPYVTVDAIQSAIVLFVELTIVEECIHLWLDAKSFGWRFFASDQFRGHDK